jgi:hypothetical protein
LYRWRALVAIDVVPLRVTQRASVLERVTLERVTGIEPASPAWKAGALPLSYTRVSRDGAARWSGRRDLNPRPPAPKAGALPLRHSPVWSRPSDLELGAPRIRLGSDHLPAHMSFRP